MAQVSKLTIDNTKVPSNQTDFPVYVDLSDMNADFWSTVKGGGKNTHALDLESSSSQYASITDASQTGLDITGDFTFEFWINLESFAVGQLHGLIGKFGVGSQRSYLLRLINNGGTPELVVTLSSDGTFSNQTQTTTTLNTVSTGVWIHLAVVYDASAGTIDTYQDGVALTQQSGHNSSIFNGSEPFILGGDNAFLDGLIDDVRVWNDIRTPTEIADNYAKILTGTETNLQGYWKFNNDYTDETSNGNDLTASGSPVFSTDIAPNQAGGDIRLYKSSANASVNTNTLDLEASSSEYASITDASQTGLDITGDLTMEAWVKLESQPATNDNYIIAQKGTFTTDAGTTKAYGFRYDDVSGTNNLVFSNNAIGSGSSVTVREAYTLSLDTWTHVAVVYDASAGSAQFIVNGSSIGTQTGLNTSIHSGGGAFGVGADAEAVEKYFDGKIADVRVWSDIRTQAEISEYYNEQLLGTEANLEGYWKLDGDLLDYTSGAQENNNDLTHSGTATYATDVPYTIAGELSREVVSCNKLTQDLVSYYKFANGAYATDSVGSNTLTTTGSTQQASGFIDYGGSGDKIATGSNMGSTGTSDITISWWTKMTTDITATGVGLMFQNSTATTDRLIALDYEYNGGTRRLNLYNSNNSISASHNVSLGTTWHHITVVRKNTLADVYLDGVKVMSGVAQSTATGTQNNLFLGTGKAFGGSSNNYYDELGFWNRALSAEEIDILYNSGTGIQASDYTEGTGELHFKYTGTLSSSADTEIAVYADGVSSDYATTDTYGRNAVWSDYDVVYHCNDTGSSLTDSAGNHNATGATAGTTGATGKLGKAISLNGSTNSYTLGTGEPAQITVTGWYNVDVLPSASGVTSEYCFWDFGSDGGGQTGVQFIGLKSNDKLQIRQYDPTGGATLTGSTVPVGTWFHHAYTYASNGDGNVYLNAVSENSSNYGDGTINSSARLERIGRATASGTFAPMDFDEFRIATTDFSADWITTEYNNQNSSETFYSVSEGVTPAVSVTVTIPTFNKAITKPADSVLVTASIPTYAVEGDSFIRNVNLQKSAMLVDVTVPSSGVFNSRWNDKYNPSAFSWSDKY